MAVTVLDPLLSDAQAARMVAMWQDFASFGQYSSEGFDTGYAPSLPQRFDAAANFVRTGGRFGRTEDISLAAARTNYFRETYAYGDETYVADIETFRDHPALIAAAQAIHHRDVVVPAIVYANVLLPGQELAVHTDVPEFRGANRKVVPQWLLVVMLHSGLFEPWRIHIATGIAYFGRAYGGELAYYPDGPDGSAEVYAPTHNTAAVLDTDTVFHGVDRVAGDDSVLARLHPGMHLEHQADDQWHLLDSGSPVADLCTDDLRYSVSWKAYCFADEAERAAWREHQDDLSLATILDTLEDDLRASGGLTTVRPTDEARFGQMLIEHYIQFPTAQSA